MIENVLKPILNLFIKPITTTQEQANKSSLKRAYVYAAIISAVFMICRAIPTFFSVMFTRKYSYNVRDYVTEFDISNFGSFATSIITTLVITFLIILAVAGIMYIISKILKNDISYTKLLTISIYAVIPVAIASILTLLVSWFFSPLGVLFTILGMAYAVYILVYTFRNMLKIENEDMLAICNIAVIGIITFVTYLVAMNALQDILTTFIK